MDKIQLTSSKEQNSKEVNVKVQVTEAQEEPKSEIVKESIETLNISRISQKPQGCYLNCKCMRCEIVGYSTNCRVQDLEQVLFKGPIIYKLHLQNISHMISQAILNYTQFWNFTLKEITKLKCVVATPMHGLSSLFITLNHQQHSEQIMVNHSSFNEFFTQMILAKLAVINHYGVPFKKFTGNFQGQVFVNSFMGGWNIFNVDITPARIRLQHGKQISEIRELWTRFAFIDKGTPCLIVKFWDGIIKTEYGLPINRLSQLLMAMSSLVRSA